jgi:hypothetical protein
MKGVGSVGICPQWRLRPNHVGIFVAIIVPKGSRDKVRPVKSVEKLSKIGPLCMPDYICTFYFFDILMLKISPFSSVICALKSIVM